MSENKLHISETIVEIINPTESDPILGVKDRRHLSREERLAADRKQAQSVATPFATKLFGVILIIGALAAAARGALAFPESIAVFSNPANSVVTRVFEVLCDISIGLTLITFVVFGIRLLLGNHRGARMGAEAAIVLLIIDFLLDLSLTGMTFKLATYALFAFVLIAMLTYIDPTLSDERKLQHKLRDMETRDAVQAGTLGLDKTHKGYIELNFFNLFWIFVIAAFIGDMLETVMHVLVFDPGHYQDRAGLLWGPFSPIYGFGAVLMTLALNRFHKAHIIVVFLVSAVIGGAFEYATSWFMQLAYGAVAWDYTGTFLSIGGRTNGFFMCMWGLLGVVWIKVLLPIMLRMVNLIPWKWRYSITTLAAVFMVVDGTMTLLTLDFWYERLAGALPDNALEEFCAKHFNNEFMSNRFESMTINPDTSIRTKPPVDRTGIDYFIA